MYIVNGKRINFIYLLNLVMELRIEWVLNIFYINFREIFDFEWDDCILWGCLRINYGGGWDDK